jgi:hypothetical protein
MNAVLACSSIYGMAVHLYEPDALGKVEISLERLSVVRVFLSDDGGNTTCHRYEDRYIGREV